MKIANLAANKVNKSLNRNFVWLTDLITIRVGTVQMDKIIENGPVLIKIKPQKRFKFFSFL